MYSTLASLNADMISLKSTFSIERFSTSGGHESPHPLRQRPHHADSFGGSERKICGIVLLSASQNSGVTVTNSHVVSRSVCVES
jgi:hypothetical protein